MQVCMLGWAWCGATAPIGIGSPTPVNHRPHDEPMIACQVITSLAKFDYGILEQQRSLDTGTWLLGVGRSPTSVPEMILDIPRGGPLHGQHRW